MKAMRNFFLIVGPLEDCVKIERPNNSFRYVFFFQNRPGTIHGVIHAAQGQCDSPAGMVDLVLVVKCFQLNVSTGVFMTELQNLEAG